MSASGEPTARSERERELEFRATHDPLTGLANRTLLFDRIRRATEGLRGAGTDRSVALLFIDLDHFKVVNDHLGHRFGDRILEIAAERISSVVRPGDTVARFGGDEFVVLCERLEHRDDAVVIADRVDTSLREPVRVDGLDVPLAVSIGIAYADASDRDPQAILDEADVAMYQAKSEGRGRWVVFDEALRDRAARRQRLETALRATSRGEELELRYQPVMELASGRITGVEALVSWRVDGEVLPPSEFVPLAERTGLIVPIGEWAVRTAAEQVGRWQRLPDHEDLHVAVNVSARQVHDPSFPAVVAAVRDEALIRPGSLWLEITESVLLEDVATAGELLEELAGLGARLALDDFGTGYSSLTYLRRLPVDSVKLDRSFVAGVGRDDVDTAIVTAVVELAAALGKECVAEGIETLEQLEVLRELGCGSGQGYLISPALEPDAMEELLRTGLGPPLTA